MQGAALAIPPPRQWCLREELRDPRERVSGATKSAESLAGEMIVPSGISALVIWSNPINSRPLLLERPAISE